MTVDTAGSSLDLAACMRAMIAAGLGVGRSGNASLRIPGGMRITPSGVEPERLDPADVVDMDLDGRILAGALRPSSEWRMHAGIYRARPDAQAIVHCHSRHATALACCGRDIPAFHYMVAVAGGDSIRCAPYAPFGTQELADAALVALGGRKACLLANHGQIALGETLAAALALAREVEELAAQYAAALAVGGVRVLDEKQMREVIARFADYGQQPDAEFRRTP